MSLPSYFGFQELTCLLFRLALGGHFYTEVCACRSCGKHTHISNQRKYTCLHTHTINHSHAHSHSVFKYTHTLFILTAPTITAPTIHKDTPTPAHTDTDSICSIPMNIPSFKWKMNMDTVFPKTGFSFYLYQIGHDDLVDHTVYSRGTVLRP